MDARKTSTAKFAILLIFVIFASDMCKKSAARGPIVTFWCQTNDACEHRFPNHGYKCINHLCQPPKISHNDLQFIST
ncbi:Nodule Cysteine-Rich (NCR) secreted peptide [Medicago truncatula]|uniref:Nodule Cysteine-Rich (NCR) secreted peptide n=1 Tax=Medicago truncatula TaxID=3880 RepID=G7KDX9_MEDTR|nr:Nodule Cysteine-Rich (NCR) secreted peptide [Medicago truncatula]